jgi:hypothetical protein
MATNIFGREGGSVKGAFSADTLKLQIGGDSDLLVQNLRVQYQQQVSKIYDLSSSTPSDAYYVAGRADGQSSMQKVMGPSADVSAFYSKFGDPCNEGRGNLVLSGEFGCAGAASGNTSVTLEEPVITSFGMAVNANDVLITEDTTMIFHNLYMT